MLREVVPPRAARTAQNGARPPTAPSGSAHISWCLSVPNARRTSAKVPEHTKHNPCAANVSSQGLRRQVKVYSHPPTDGEVVRDGCDAGRPMTVALLMLAVLLGAACAAALARRREGRRGAERLQERQRMRDELKSISVDVLAQTGDSLAQRLEHQ